MRINTIIFENKELVVKTLDKIATINFLFLIITIIFWGKAEWIRWTMILPIAVNFLIMYSESVWRREKREIRELNKKEEENDIRNDRTKEIKS